MNMKQRILNLSLRQAQMALFELDDEMDIEDALNFAEAFGAGFYPIQKSNYHCED